MLIFDGHMEFAFRYALQRVAIYMLISYRESNRSTGYLADGHSI